MQEKFPEYVTPEVVTSLLDDDTWYNKQHKFKSDIFSLGLTLLELSTYLPSKNLYDRVMK